LLAFNFSDGNFQRCKAQWLKALGGHLPLPHVVVADVGGDMHSGPFNFERKLEFEKTVDELTSHMLAHVRLLLDVVTWRVVFNLVVAELVVDLLDCLILLLGQRWILPEVKLRLSGNLSWELHFLLLFIW
jgi:hypothetical protein